MRWRSVSRRGSTPMKWRACSRSSSTTASLAEPSALQVEAQTFASNDELRLRSKLDEALLGGFADRVQRVVGAIGIVVKQDQVSRLRVLAELEHVVDDGVTPAAFERHVRVQVLRVVDEQVGA